MNGPVFGDPKPDILGTGYQAMTLDLADDDEGPVQSTLVRFRASAATSRAVLYVHGFADYFFQTELAEFHAARGDDFYAIDLHKYGRSLRPHQTPYQMADVADYYGELDTALRFILGERHDRVVINAHSTGGLIIPLWLHDRRLQGDDLDAVQGIVLNSPFLEIPANRALRTIAARPIDAMARSRPLAVFPSLGPSFYNQSIHRSARGEWDFVEEWKPVNGGVVRVGWIAAAQRAIRRVQAGLGLPYPILVLCSRRTIRARTWSDDFYAGDSVLHTDGIARSSMRLGTHVTCIRVDRGMHDLLLSAPDVRQRVYAEIDRWMNAYTTADGVAQPARAPLD
jgi:alpha-beta hydrolase superfamily lysophospholipase